MAKKAFTAVARLAVLAMTLDVGCGGVRQQLTSTPTNPTGNTSGVATGPMFDGWWDSGSKGLRIVYGIPGAAHEGALAYNDGTYSGAAVCMRGNVALLQSSSSKLFQARLPQGTPIPIDNATIVKPTVVFSPSCSSALAYSISGGTAVLIQGANSIPKALSLSLPQGNSVLAVSDAGSVLLGSTRSDGSSVIQLLPYGSSVLKPVAVLSKPGGSTFIPGNDSALIADADASTVFEASQITGDLSLTRIAGPGDGVNKPLAIGVSADGRTAAVANGMGSKIVRIDLSGQTAAVQTVCRCTPSELVAQTGNLSFRLNEAGAGTVWSFDGDASTPRTVFVPSQQTTASQGAHR
jgi:hypothetical protein